MKSNHVGAAGALLLLSAALQAQGIWIVDQLNRPGTQFTDLPPAVAAASSGDIILVRYAVGSQQPYQATTITMPLTILGEQIGTPGPNSTPILPRLTGALQVNGIAAGGTVILAGLELQSDGTTVSGLYCLNVAGRLQVSNCVLMAQSYFGAMTLRFTNCHQVVLQACRIGAHGGGTTAIGSRLWIEDCTMWSAQVLWPWPSLPGKNALDLVASQATVVRSWLSGTGGYWSSGFSCAWVGTPTTGAATIDANSILAAGPQSRLSGVQNVASWPCIGSWWDGAVGNLGTLILDPACTVDGPISGNVVTTPQWQTWSSLAPIGGVLTAGIHALPSTPVILAASLQPPLPLPSPFGEFWLEPQSTMVLKVGLADANGDLAHHLPVGTWIPLGRLLAFQAAVLLPNGNAVLATPSSTPILPPRH